MKTTKAMPSDATFLESILEPRPLMVARQEAHKIFIGLCGQTLANLAHEGSGPEYFRRGKICWYRISDIEAWLTQQPVKTNGKTL